MFQRAYCDAESQGLSLESFLVKPIQRIPRYRLLLAGLCFFFSFSVYACMYGVIYVVVMYVVMYGVMYVVMYVFSDMYVFMRV